MADVRVYRGWFIVEHPDRWVAVHYGEYFAAPTLAELERLIDEAMT